MKNLKLTIGILFVLYLAVPCFGLVVKGGDAVKIAADEIIDDDLIIFAQSIDIDGTVDGDVVAFAQAVTITGTVNGTITCGAATVKIDAQGVNSIWAAARSIEISGSVDKNVLIAGQSLCICDGALIGKDVKAYGERLDVEGEVDGTITGGVGFFDMEGISGNVNINAGKSRIGSEAQIDGDLIVEGESEPNIEDGAIITGETKFKKFIKRKKTDTFALARVLGVFVLMLRVIDFIAKLIVGIILITLSMKFVRRIMDTLLSKPLKSLGFGFLVFIIIPAAVLILFAVIIGFPFAILGIYIYSILLYLSSIFVGLVVGEKVIQLFKKEGAVSLYLSFILGFVILTLLGMIPVLGFIIKFAVILFGMGMLYTGTWSLIKEIKEKKLI